MKPIEIIKQEEKRLKESIKQSIVKFEEVTGIRIDGLEYIIQVEETDYNRHLITVIKVTYTTEYT